MDLSNFVIILCRASDPGNVGAVCRVMKNMGLSQLRLVEPGALKSRLFMEETTLLARAIHAGDIWQKAQFFDTLAEAAADCTLTIGTTRRRGRKRKNVTLEPRALVEWLKGGKPPPALQPSGLTLPPSAGEAPATPPIAIVFGNERTGLDDDELNFCSIASHIPVSDAFPSLNLSHAVQIYAYELFLAFGGEEDTANVKGEWVALTRPAVDELIANITNTLANIGFYKQPGREEQTRFLRDLICRAGLTEREGRYFSDIFIKTARLGGK